MAVFAMKRVCIAMKYRDIFVLYVRSLLELEFCGKSLLFLLIYERDSCDLKMTRVSIPFVELLLCCKI